MRYFWLFIFVFFFEGASFAAKKDFKGLFGSFRREKFTENEARSSDLGVDIMLSTLLPVSKVAMSTETRGGSANGLNYSAFFNVEGSIFYTLSYHFETYLSLSYYTYETRKENATNSLAYPVFHIVEISAYPVMVGVRYRLATEDIVPYIGIGAGVAFTSRKGSYDSAKATIDKESMTVPVAQAQVGLEFFFAPRAGIRLEASAFYFGLKARNFDSGAQPENIPILNYQGNVISVRYASGLFFLF